MAKGKKEQAMMLDPNRFKIAQQNAVMPGGPPNQQGNPMNVQSVVLSLLAPMALAVTPTVTLVINTRRWVLMY